MTYLCLNPVSCTYVNVYRGTRTAVCRPSTMIHDIYSVRTTDARVYHRAGRGQPQCQEIAPNPSPLCVLGYVAILAVQHESLQTLAYILLCRSHL